MVSDVKASVMIPSRSSHQHGPPLLGRVRGPARSPASSLLCGPPTSSFHRPVLWFSLAAGLPLPSGRGDTRTSQVTGSSLLKRAAIPNPVRCALGSPQLRLQRFCLRHNHTRSTSDISEIFGANSCGPPVCLPTHRRSRYRGRRKADSRPAGLGFDRTGISPAGRLSGFLRGYRMLSSLPTSIAWSHVMIFTSGIRSRTVTRPRSSTGRSRISWRSSRWGSSPH